MPLLSVITATKDLVASGRKDSFRRCAESISRLATPHEHIVLDAASEDETVALLEAVSNECGNFRFVSEPDTGVYNAFNKGIRAACGKWLYFIGSDDYVFDPAALDEAVAEAESSGREMIISRVRNSDGSCWFSGPRDFGNILLYKPYGHQGVLMTKNLILRLGLFDESYRIVSDFKLCLSAHLLDIKHVFIDRAYAEFSVGFGLSTSGDVEYAERIDVPAKMFGLNASERAMLGQYQLLPLRVLVPLLFHRNEAIRIGARHALLRRGAHLLGLIGEHEAS